MTQGPHDPQLPGGPMSCQSVPGHEHHRFYFKPLNLLPMVIYFAVCLHIVS
ncbi:unnamed protein product [Staurois parvus]|uniref:Uncharacterized protein n=1 Tax=Staurois parvus TaxID=386267 RepID=A0ABN9B8V1_9NEOB|nr:unnamed protein product [Staurois parvus]